jgi:hypothetical protein
MATFVDKEYPIRSASFNQCRVHANIGARRFFGRSLTRIDLQIRNLSVAVHFLRGTGAGNAGECERRSE